MNLLNNSKEQQIILAHILVKSREFVIAHPEIKLAKSQQKRKNLMHKRLQNGEPLAYVLGQKEFFGFDFVVNKNTLIPRPETEMLVEEAISHITNGSEHIVHNKKTGTKDKTPACFVIDVGTGSGCIIASIVHKLGLCQKHNPSLCKFIATDTSSQALKVAKKNAKKHGVEDKISFIKSDLLDFLLRKKNNNSTIRQSINITIIANLPYLSNKIYGQTEKSVKNFEPKSALLSGKNGLDHYRKLFEQIRRFKQKNPSAKWTVIFEISPEQKKIIEKEFPSRFDFDKISFKKDLAGKWRVATVCL